MPIPSAETSEDSPQQPRDRWTVHQWGGSVVQVFVTPPQTQREMRELYPQAGGIVAAV